MDSTRSRFVHALRTQKGQAESAPTSALPCPYGHQGRIFANINQLFDHVKADHSTQLQNLSPLEARAKVKELALKLRSDQSSDATAGDRSAPDIAGLTLDADKQNHQTSPPSKKRLADSELSRRRGKSPYHVEIADLDYSRHIPYSIGSDQVNERYLFEHKGTSSPYHSTPEPSSEWSVEANKSSHFRPSQPQSPSRQLPQRTHPKPKYSQCQRGIIELQKYDSRYPDLLLQPDSRPISQEQLASEVKSIYAGLTMVETKCIHVDRAQAAAVQDNTDPQRVYDHWQALITLHRTLLHEHHDFFLASQHPSASPALRRLAAKYSMPARMWKHGIHAFLELLRRRLPESIDYMLAFIYLAYQMMALLYETVPAFEDTWIECLGDLGRYRMAIEDENVRDRKTWAGVSRSWYTKAADKNPTVGRLYHHLAILAKPNALLQIYYYSRSLTSVQPFLNARESIKTLLDPIMDGTTTSYSHDLPIDTSFIKAHALQFQGTSAVRNQPSPEFFEAKGELTENLDNHIGRVTAKWKQQGVYIAVTNIAGWFNYGENGGFLHQVFLTQLHEKAKNSPPNAADENIHTAPTAEQQGPTPLRMKLGNVKVAVLKLWDAQLITFDTFAVALRRNGDKNVLAHVHVMLSFFFSFASSTHCFRLLDGAPWSELVAFLNTLKTGIQLQSQSQTQTQNIDRLLATNLFPGGGETSDEYPLPEDYLMRGLMWTHDYFPENWFERDQGEEERYLETASTGKNRVERVLKLGYALTRYSKWISYDEMSHTFKSCKETKNTSCLIVPSKTREVERVVRLQSAMAEIISRIRDRGLGFVCNLDLDIMEI